MTALGDKIKRWCQEESLPLVTEQDEEAGLVCAVSLPGDPQLSVSVRASAAAPGRVLVAHACQPSVPAEMAADPEGPQRFTVLLERVAGSRSGLVECRPVMAGEKLAAEVVVTLHEDGLSKQSFLTSLEEVRKVGRVIAWELEGISAGAEMLSDVQAIVEQTGALASELERAAGGAERAAARAEGQPSVQAAPSAAEPTPPPPPPAPVAPATGGVFCTECGRQARPGARFCNGCGASLEV
jgi:hypothetical protein